MERAGSMCCDSEGEGELLPRRSSTTTALAMPHSPHHVTDKSSTHSGQRVNFVSVTQVEHNTEVVKGDAPGVELETGMGRHKSRGRETPSRRMRSRASVFVCWALAVAAGLVLYLLCHNVLAEQPERFDLELQPSCYLQPWRRGSRRAHWAALSATLAALALGGALVYALGGAHSPAPDAAPYVWNVTRRTWSATSDHSRAAPHFKPALLPLRLVVVQHTAGVECYRLDVCAALIREMQRYFLSSFGYDVPYNFLIGNDGRVYEGRGWTGVAAHSRGVNHCSLGLGFTGDYRREFGGAHASELQLNRTLQLLEGGVRDGMLHARYVLLAASDLLATVSPGDGLYDALRQLPHFIADKHRFRGRSCEDIYAELQALDDKPIDEPLALDNVS